MKRVSQALMIVDLYGTTPRFICVAPLPVFISNSGDGVVLQYLTIHVARKGYPLAYCDKLSCVF